MNRQNKIHDLNDQYQSRLSVVFKDHGVFFAFSDEQFAENKTPLEPGDKYVRWAAGGFLPKSKVNSMTKALTDLRQWFEDEIKAGDLREDHILYELNNHEAFYTGEIEDTLSALGRGYTAQEVWDVYKKYQAQAWEKLGW